MSNNNNNRLFLTQLINKSHQFYFKFPRGLKKALGRIRTNNTLSKAFMIFTIRA